MRWVTRVDLRREESLAFLTLPTSRQDPSSQLLPPGPSPRPRKNHAASPDAQPNTQLIAAPTPSQPASVNEPSTPVAPAAIAPAPIDWSAEAELALKQYAELALAAPPRALDRHGAGADLNGGLGPDRPAKPEFGWDQNQLHRVEGIDGGGILVHINDHCVFVLFPFPFAGCGIGKIPVRGDLFEHLHDVPTQTPNAKNSAP